MKKQTAVEWLIKKLENRQNGIFDGLPHLSVDEIYAKAKEMEKEQIVEAYLQGDEDGFHSTESQYDYEIEGRSKYVSEKYYNETYGK